jgi:hypothetical protein
MDFEQLKNSWQNDKGNNSLDINLENREKFHFPLDKMKKNMKMELVSALFIFPIMLVVLLRIEDAYVRLLSVLLLLIAGMITGYYYFKFYKLYHKITHIDLGVFQNLVQLKYELQLNVELYKSYVVAFVPILFGELILIFDHFKIINEMDFNRIIMTIATTFLLGIITLYLTIKIWIYVFYEKYILQISNLIVELYQDEELKNLELENQSLFSVNFTFVDATELFLKRFLNNRISEIINVILWFCVVLLVVYIIILGFRYVLLNFF